MLLFRYVKTYKSLILFFLPLYFACSTEDKYSNPQTKEQIQKEVNQTETVKELIEFKEFSRDSSFMRIKNKIQKKESLVIHIMIPLCDNDNQGIVPVSAKLGNGLDLRNNLYWGAKYGIKNHFKKYTDWTFVKSELDITEETLERVTFKRSLSNGGQAYIIAEAYRGDKMKECMLDYFDSLAGKKKEETQLAKKKIGIYSNADLLILNGHNGLMDYDIKFIPTEDNLIRETAVIGCISHSYFKDHLLATKGYPILMTTGLMAPEAYVAEALIDSWLQMNIGETIRKDAGKAYHKYQKCGIKGATNLFISGW